MMSVKQGAGRDHPMVEPMVWIAITMALSMLWLVIHNLLEFGLASLLALSTGTIPMLLIGAALAVIWWQVSQARAVCTALMIGYSILNLVGGGVISVLPLAVLPFEPEQSLSHYASYVFYSITQILLLWLGARYLFPNEHSLDEEIRNKWVEK